MVDWAKHTARMIARAGREVTITPSVLPARKVTAVFTTFPDVALNVETYLPTLRLTTADAAQLQRGDAVSVGGVEYTIARLQPDVDAGDALATLETV